MGKEINGLGRLSQFIDKEYGKEIIARTSNINSFNIKSISTGSISLNNALGVGGIPKGRVIEIYGGESAGKTTLAYSIAKHCQKLEEKCIFIDAEHAFDYDYAQKNGIIIGELEDKNAMTVIQPDFGEQALEIVQKAIETKEVGLIIVDSVASLVPKAEIEGEMIDDTIALQARLMSKMLRKLTGIISKTNTAVIFINQIRSNIHIGYGSPSTTTGGRALRFYASIRIELKRIKTIKQGEDCIGSLIQANIVKNKVAPPFRSAEFEIYFDEGLSETADILEIAIKNNIIEQSGSWFTYKGTSLSQGKEKVRQELKSNEKLFNEIKQQVLKLFEKEKNK